MVCIVDRTDANEWKIIGPFANEDIATHWGANNLPGGITGEWGWYTLEAPETLEKE